MVEVGGGITLPLVQRGVAPMAEDWFDVSGKLKAKIQGELGDTFALLSSAERQAVLDLLKSHDPKALVALANMKLNAGGIDFTAELFDGLKFKGSVEGFKS